MAEEIESKKRHRSPAYPACGLPEAIERLRRFRKDQGRATVHLNAAYESLGYKAGSSNGGRVVAALISYGFMHDEGTGVTRKVKISDAGLRAVVLDEGSPEWKAVIREAATRPKLFADLVATWPDGLPSDKAIENHLLLELNFNADALPGLVKDFKATYEFAELGNAGTLHTQGSGKDGRSDEGLAIDPHGWDDDEPESSRDATPQPRAGKTMTQTLQEPPAGMESMPIVVGPGQQIVVHYPSILTKAQLATFDKVWAIYRPMMDQAIQEPSDE